MDVKAAKHWMVPAIAAEVVFTVYVAVLAGPLVP